MEAVLPWSFYEAQSILPDEFPGNPWLKAASSRVHGELGHPLNNGDSSLNLIIQNCVEISSSSLKKIFPDRKLPASKIKNFNIDFFEQLSSEDFFTILDLIDQKRALEILASKKSAAKEKTLFFIVI